MKQALHYEKLEGSLVRCRLCRHECEIADGATGICAVRENRGGTLYSRVYDRVTSINVDPIEKKPFFHVRPGSGSLSIATAGCNMQCRHCQNHSLSQAPRRQRIPGKAVPPAAIAAEARDRRCASIAYTYSEPTIFYELARDTMEAAARFGVLNVWVTNGFMGAAVLEEMSGLLTAANVDVKSFRETFYKQVCKARLAPVLDNVARMRALGIWVELTTLIIPGYNDDEAELRDLAGWIASVDPSMPWHVSRFHPDNELLDARPTPVRTLARARDIGREAGLEYVYTGNVPGDEGESTFCPACAARLVERVGFSVGENRLEGGKCPECGHAIAGRW